MPFGNTRACGLLAILLAARGAAQETTGIRHHDRARLADAAVNQQDSVHILVAVRTAGETPTVVQGIVALGGRIEYRADPVGYLRALVPTRTAELLARRSDVLALNIGWDLFWRSASESTGRDMGAPSHHVMAPDSTTPPRNPYVPTQDMGAPQFTSAHPTYDGRGVVIADVEATGAVEHPALQRAYTLDGRPVRKIIGQYTTDSTMMAEGAIGYIAMHDTVVVRGGSFVRDGRRYVAPHDGLFRFGVFDEQHDKYLKRINADANPPQALRRFAVLWDPRTDTVWFDAAARGDFRGATPLTDYNAGGGYLMLSTQAATSAWDPRVSLAVTLNRARASLYLWIGGYGHGTATGGVAAGSDLWGGHAGGVSPGAQLVQVEHYGGPLIEACIEAAQHPETDLLTLQSAFALRAHDGRTVTGVILSRLVTAYGKLIFASAGNAGPGMSTLDEAPEADGVLGVGGYINRTTWMSDFGALAPATDYVHPLSSRGPRADGGRGPSLIAPVCSVVPVPTSYQAAHHGWQPSNGLYDYPVGYDVNCGTSYAAPMAAGAAALLISAAKQAHVPYDAAHLRAALLEGAQRIEGYTVREQGAGLVRVDRAWDALRRGVLSPVDTVIVRAPVRSAVAEDLVTPNVGAGLYERDGWAAGMRATRTITLIRTSGPSAPVQYQLRWRDNDGTFTTATSVTSPLGAQVGVPVTIAPRASGLHDATLEVVRGARTIREIPVAVIAASRPGVSVRESVPWLAARSVFVAVPSGTRSLTLDLAIGRGRVEMRGYDPAGGVMQDAYTPYQTAGAATRTIRFPEPGVWEFAISNADTRDTTQRFRVVPAAEVSLRATVDTTPLSPLTHPERLVLEAGSGPAIREVQIDSGIARLTVRLTNPSDPTADIDLYLYNCTGPSSPAGEIAGIHVPAEKPRCWRAGSAVYAGGQKAVVVERPARGLWKVAVDPWHTPRGTTEVDYGVEVMKQ